ncbi:copper resistance D family protein [Rhodopila sp.]|uniref:copper resistance D family protein n=1 Tax=Rhodopila sp. TaxID=2480087 RepID=UPI002BE1AFA2|nr:CopD family protein [Rhodopila sp.]HVZ07299.1 CopD family protein [Rhodopila sp.]
MTAVAVLRGLHLAALLSGLGAAGFLLWVMPAAGDARPATSAVVTLCRASLGLALLLGTVWFALLAGAIADADTAGAALAALPVVASQTWVGHALLVRFALVLLALVLAVLLPVRPKPASARTVQTASAKPGLHDRHPPAIALSCILVIIAIGLGIQGMIGHAGAGGSAALVISEWLHLLAAGLWLGGLLPLWLAIARLAPANAASVCERFSPIALACVLVLAATGVAQGLALIGSLPALPDTPYGRIALIKIALFLMALALAAVNRLWLTDRLAARHPCARPAMRASVLAETAIGLGIVMAAASLASHEPGVDQQPPASLSWLSERDCTITCRIPLIHNAPPPPSIGRSS